MDVMDIRVDTLKGRPRQLLFEEPAEAFTALAELAADGTVAFRGMVRAELVAMLVDALVEVEGTLAATVVLSCSRCLQPVEQQLVLPVALAFTRQAPVVDENREDVELDEAEIGLIPFEGDTLDLRDPLQQELLMGLPQHPLCGENCAGLCPWCGIDLNHQRCDCTPPLFHEGLAVLKGFKAAKE